MNSKLIASHREQFANMAVDAVLALDQDLREDLIGIKQVRLQLRARLVGSFSPCALLARGVA